MSDAAYSSYTIHTRDGNVYDAVAGDGTTVTIGDTWVTIRHSGDAGDTWIPVRNILAIDAHDPVAPATCGMLFLHPVDGPDRNNPCVMDPGHAGSHTDAMEETWLRTDAVEP